MVMDAKLSKEDPTPFGVKSHRARNHLGSNPLKRANNQIIVQSSAGATHHSKYIRLLEDERVLYPIKLVDLDMLVSLFTRYYDNFDMNTRVLVLLTKTYSPV